MDVNILPADSYVVINKNLLNDNDKKILTMLYQPIIGVEAVNLYLTLWSDLDQNELMSTECNHHHLMSCMRKKLEEIIIAREKLEAIGLLKTYYKQEKNENLFVYELFKVLSPSEFLSHPILNIVLFNNIGRREYERIVSYYKLPSISLNDYKDITKSFYEVFESLPGTMFENSIKDIKKNKKLNLTIGNNFDFNLLIASFPSETINKKAFTNDIKELINDLSFIYEIDEEKMKNIITNSLNEKLLIDKVSLRKNAKNLYQFENGGKLPSLIYQKQPEYLRSALGSEGKRAKMIYTFENISPYHFLKSKYKGSKPTTRDMNLVENLVIDVGLKPAVVNVLIDYVLKINNKSLSKNFVETIAGQWKRLNIQTAEEAMKEAEKEYKKLNRIKETKKVYEKKETKVPEWFEKETKKSEITEEEENELKNMLKEFE